MVDIAGKMTLWAIEIFVAAVEEGTISSAAKRLSSSPSAISQQLTNLENGLGVLLLNRANRPIELTSAGRLFLRRAQNILSESTQAKAELAVFNFSKMMRLRVGVVDDFDADVTPALMMKLSKRLRDCQFLLETDSSHHLSQELESRAMDVIITADTPTEDWMDVFPLLTEPFIVVAPRGSVNPRGDVAAQLLKMPFIRYSSTAMMGRQIEAHLARQRINLPNRFEFNNYHAILCMVADKAGWAITTPLGYLRAYRFVKDVEVMPLPFKDLTRTISLVARRGALGDIPKEIAELTRPLLQKKLIDPCVRYIPWLESKFKLIDVVNDERLAIND